MKINVSELREKLSRLMPGLSGRSPIKDIKQIKKEVDEICGGAPAKPKVNKEKVVAIVDTL